MKAIALKKIVTNNGLMYSLRHARLLNFKVNTKYYHTSLYYIRAICPRET